LVWRQSKYLVIKARYKILSASMLAAACLGCQRCSNAYHLVGSNILYEHDWRFIATSRIYGLDQYSYWVDTDGVTIIDPRHDSQQAGAKRTYTAIYLGERVFTVRAPAWSVIALGVTALGLGLWSIGVVVSGIAQRRLEPDDDPTKKEE
jgi:hypothetical protein